MTTKYDFHAIIPTHIHPHVVYHVCTNRWAYYHPTRALVAPHHSIVTVFNFIYGTKIFIKNAKQLIQYNKRDVDYHHDKPLNEPMSLTVSR